MITSLGLALLFGASGCAYRKAVVVDDLLVPLASDVARVPSPTDLAAARLARVALVSSIANSDRPDAALAALEAAPKDDDEERLTALAADLRNATLDDPIAYRDASRRLRRRFGIDPRLASRLDETIADDPLRIARRRKRDDWHRLFARTFNSVAEPLGQSVITGFFLAPYTLANSFIHYFAEFSNAEPLSTTGRQALVLRQEFLAAHPESEIAPEVARLVERDRIRLEKTLARRRTRVAQTAIDGGQPGLALHHARAATAILAPHPDRNASIRRKAARLTDRASALVAERDRLAARTLEARPTEPFLRESERALATALLARRAAPGALEPELARHASTAGSDGYGRVAFIDALARNEGGHEEPARRALAELAGQARHHDPMTRHARQLVEDDWQNPWDAFRRLRSSGRRNALAYRFAGEWVNRPRYPNLWPPVSYLIDTPTIAMTIVLAPLRALISPFTGFPDFQRATSSPATATCCAIRPAIISARSSAGSTTTSATRRPSAARCAWPI
ncbi:MAG: hypothetical protein IPK00_12645 [Deltaproteobacteria bacterium]|nr:hypothetical protein [Deltaproteobacteria bacterium]